MPPDEFRAAMEPFGYAQEGFAIALGYSGRAGQRWATGEAKVPGAVAVVLRLLQARPELASVLAEIAPMPEAKKRSRAGRRPAAPDRIARTRPAKGRAA
jgi:hypothetical protein